MRKFKETASETVPDNLFRLNVKNLHNLYIAEIAGCPPAER